MEKVQRIIVCGVKQEVRLGGVGSSDVMVEDICRRGGRCCGGDEEGACPDAWEHFLRFKAGVGETYLSFPGDENSLVFALEGGGGDGISAVRYVGGKCEEGDVLNDKKKEVLRGDISGGDFPSLRSWSLCCELEERLGGGEK